MKHLKPTISVLLFLIATNLMSQVMVSLNVDANPTPYISQWANQDEVVMVTVSNINPGLEGIDYRISIKMELEGSLVVQTNTAQVVTRQVPFGTEVFMADEVIDYNALQFYGTFATQIAQTGMLPAGTYSFCVSLVDLNGVIISAPMEVCKPMTITSYQAPELIFPTQNVQLQASALQSTSLTWSPLTPVPPAIQGLKYVVAVSEVYPHQTPSQAFFANMPLIEEEVMAGNQLLWPPEVGMPEDTIQYVWSVKAVNFDDQPYIPQNSGFASISHFTVVPDVALLDDQEEEEQEPTGTIALSDTIYAGYNNQFAVITTEVGVINGKYFGKGNVFVGWLNASIQVMFDSITVDTNMRLITGKILSEIHENAPVYPLAWVMQAGPQDEMTNEMVGDIATFVENNTQQTLFYNNPSELEDPLKMPLGLMFQNGTEVAITEMVFLPDTSKFNSIAALALPPNMVTERLGFRVMEVRFRPHNLVFPTGRIELVEDISTTNINNKIEFVFKAPDDDNLGCYVEWDEDGFSEYGLQITTLFTRDWMLPSPDNDPNQRVSATLSVQGTSWNDLILGGTMDKFEIPGSGGMTMLADSIYYDFSDQLNPPGIVFPPNYPGDTTETFRGFYMNAFEIELPLSWQTQAGNPPKIAAHNIIINNTGITLLAQATSVIQFPGATVADLAASIDTVHVEWIASSLVEAGIKGRIGLPVSKKDSISNPLQYTAVFNNPILPEEPVSFQLSITPTGPIPAHLLKADIELAQTSSIVAYVDKNKKTFDMNLDGSLSWGTVNLGPVKDVNLGLDFEGLGMDYDSSKGENDQFGFNIGSWAFASEQKFLANFPVTIDKIGFVALPSQPNQLMRGKMTIDVIFNLNEDIGGMTGMGVEMAMLRDIQGQKFYPQYLSTSLDSIAIQANLAAVSINGAIGFRQDHPVFGNGFIGTLHANFKPVGIQASALAEFGNTSYLNGSQLYRYWRVQADLTLPPPGVVFLPGVAFRGFGGGAYNNMEATLSGTTYSFSPKKSSLGLQAKAIIATSPKEEGFNADVILAGQFNQNTGGLTFINFTGDFWVAAEMNATARNKALVNGSLGATYNFPDKHFHFFTSVNVNAPPISTPNSVGFVVDVNGKNNQWYVKFGDAQTPNLVNVSLMGLGINLHSYVMFGNSISAPSGFSSSFSNQYYFATQSWPSHSNLGNGGIGSHTNTGSGFATGIGFRFNYDQQRHLKGNYYLWYGLGAGAELHLAFMEYMGACGGYSPIGINGWRASGMLGFYGFASAEVRRRGGKLKDNEWTLAHIGAGGWVNGAFPNPYYLSGGISGHVDILNVVTASFNYSFQAGTICNNQSTGVMAVDQGDAAADQEELLIQYVAPASIYNYPVHAPLAVKFGLEPDEVFDVAEQQGDGTIKMRTFKMEIARSLQIQENDGSWKTVLLNTHINNLGEYLYTTIPAQDATGPAQDFFTGQGPGPVSGQGTAAATPMATLGDWLKGGGFSASPAPAGPAAPAIPAGTSGNGTTSGPTMIGAGKFPILQVPNPPPPPTPSYGDDLDTNTGLPQNSLTADRNYQFTVSATLKEFKNNNWVNAQTLSGNTITQTVTKSFYTGAVPMATSAQQNLQNF
jgi:hypothetical protein